MDKQKIAPRDLQLGMYVELPGSWLSHDFLKNQFKISSQDQLEKVRQLKFGQVLVDFTKSDIDVDYENNGQLDHLAQSKMKALDPKYGEIPEKWDSEKLMTDDLRNVLHDKKLPPDKKSKVVYEHSVTMMEQLLDIPTAENIKASKEAIHDLSDMVLSDDETAQNMLRITSHDFYTYTHSVNVGLTSIMLSKELFKNSDAHDLQELAAGFFLHDLGKVKINAEVLNKPGRLDEKEMKHIRTHPYQGYKLLQEADELSPECATIVMQHHEAIDGSGYPKRLEDKEIHLYGKICGIADVFDALTAERSYKKAMTPFNALQLIRNQMLDRFDKSLFEEFVKIFH